MSAKPWWASRGVIGGLGTMAAGIAVIVNEATGMGLNPEEVKALIEQGAGWAFGGYFLISGFLSFWGRIKAAAPVRKQIVPKPDILPWLRGKQP